SLSSGAVQARRELKHAHLNGSSYDAILLDAQMPPDFGIELAREFDPSDRENTIIMLTCDDLPCGSRVAHEAGLNRHLIKPIKRVELLDAVESVAARAHTKLRQPPAEQERVPEAKLKGRRILLAEDSEENRLLGAAFLRGTSHHLETAENGRV